jgi:predicted membrane channel-forming protein YqfA (hemolysin III family)
METKPSDKELEEAYKGYVELLKRETKKPGATRLSFIIVLGTLAILAVPLILFAVKADVLALKDLAMLAAGAIVGALGAVTAYHFKGE